MITMMIRCKTTCHNSTDYQTNLLKQKKEEFGCVQSQQCTQAILNKTKFVETPPQLKNSLTSFA
jgi:hypothetical protein